jgi:protein-S-isoprenylcysteine O-methyltransferase Ste14
MPLHSYFVLIAFTFLLFVFVLQFIRLRNSTAEFFGQPTIEKLHFYSAKIAIFTTWALFILKAISPRLGYIDVPPGFSWTAVVLLYIGVILFSLSLFNLGKALKVGLPGQDTKLQTRGMYRLSRNPLYLGVHVIAIGSCIYFPDLINVSFTIYGIFMHHRIIKEEERFLAERFGKEWMLYSTKVSRYL